MTYTKDGRQKTNNAPAVSSFSELLADVPSDDVLAELFADPSCPQRPTVTHLGLEALKLRLEGAETAHIAEKLHTTYYQAANLPQKTIRLLIQYRPQGIEVDIPALRKILGIRPFNFTGGYTKLSELLWDMPSDEMLFRLDRERGNIAGGKKRLRVCNLDLYILQQRLAGRTYQSIGEEFGKSRELIRRRIWKIKVGLVRYLGVELDVPGLFDSVKKDSLPLGRRC